MSKSRYEIKPEDAAEVEKFRAASLEAAALVLDVSGMVLSMEFGYKACKKGYNLEYARELFQQTQ